MKEKEQLKKENAITLIALVITIIVLLILAGVTIATLTGDNGILTRAQNAKNQTEEANIIEKIRVEIMSSLDNNGKLQLSKLKENISKTLNGEIIGEEFPVIIKQDNYTFKIDSNGFIYGEEEVKSGDIFQNPSLYYGSIVSNYTINSNIFDENIEWKIFYADEENIYLIASDYIKNSNIPNGKKGSNILKNGEYNGSFDTILSDYNGVDDIKQQRIRDLNKDYFEINNYIQNNENNNMKVVAYMLDITQWDIYCNKNYADYAIGGPTLQLFINSWNSRGYTKLYYDNVNESGYYVGNNQTPSTLFINLLNTNEIQDVLYFPHEYLWNNIKGYWLASPSAYYQSDYIMMCSGSGAIGNDRYNKDIISFRPVVCLKNSIILDRQEDGIYQIK